MSRGVTKIDLAFNSGQLPVITKIIKEAGGSIRLVGGVVRDSLLGISNKDIDLATDLLPEQVQNIFTQHNIKVVPTGIKFGTVTVVIDKQPFEITTLRSDLETDGRHAKVAFTGDYKQDAERRDFTINAMSYDLEEQTLYDYFGGLGDLESGVVRFIGKPADRIKEDYLRILRFFRFTARYSKSVDRNSLKACKEYSEGIAQLSGERIKAEMDQILQGPRSIEMLSLMTEGNIWPHLFGSPTPELAKLTKLRQLAATQQCRLGLATIYAQIFLSGKMVYDVKKLLGLKLTRKEATFITSLYSILSIEDIDQKEMEITKIWLKSEEFEQYVLFCSVNNENDQDRLASLYNQLNKIKARPVFPVVSSDLLNLGLEGPAIGRAARSLEEKWISSDFTLTKTELLAQIEKGKN